MKYIIERTSDWWRKEQPCKDAYKDGIDKNGHPLWSIDICNLKQIDDLVSEVGPIIISKNNDVNEIERYIEIYDDYRE